MVKKVICCREIGLDYDLVVRAETEEEIVKRQMRVPMQRQKHLGIIKKLSYDSRFLHYSFGNIYLLAIALTITMGCASTKVEPVSSGYNGKLPKPNRILVYDFAVSPEEVSLNRAIGAKLARTLEGAPPTEEEIKVGRAVADALSKHLVKDIQNLGLPAERAKGASPEWGNALLIKGQFLSIDEGNRLRRMVIGLGAGRSEVKTYVQVYEATAEGQQLVREFETTAKSGRKPGMAETVGAGAAAGRAAESAAVSAGVGVTSEVIGDDVEADARRTAEELTKQLSQFFADQGWISKDKAK